MIGRIGRALSRCFAAAVCLLVAAPRAIVAGSYSWTTAGPEPGMVLQIVVNPQDASSVLLTSGYYGSLLFATSDQGESWRENDAISYASQLIQDPSAASVLYAVTSVNGVGGVFKSLDRGASWFAANSGLPVLATIAIAPSSSQRLYAIPSGTSGSVYRTDDGAASWILVSNAFPGTWVGDVVVDPSDPDVIYAVSSPGVLKSVDGG